MDRLLRLVNFFRIPFIVAIGIVGYILLRSLEVAEIVSIPFILIFIFIGSLDLIRDTYQSLRRGKFALDYIAIVAIITGLLTQQYLVAAVVVLMLSGGNTLEDYATAKAQNSLLLLSSRIPSTVNIWDGQAISTTKPIRKVEVGELIAVRKGEVLPLDGKLQSEAAVLDESSLTGEPYPKDKYRGDSVRSGTVNTGEFLVLKVTKPDADSSYRKIIKLVEQAQTEKSPLLRLADRYSYFFTAITFALAGLAFLLSGDAERILAVLVIATPCPLILATPVALIGGVNSAAREKIIIKKLAALEVLSRVEALILDKTGTITLGKPELVRIVPNSDLAEERALAIAAAIERNSLHPFAKALVDAARVRGIAKLRAENISEEIGKGISGKVEGKTYSLQRSGSNVNAIELSSEGKSIAEFSFIDKAKAGAKKTIDWLQKQGIEVVMFTGDSEERAQKLKSDLGLDIKIRAECSPEEKEAGIAALKKEGHVTAMLGDGINDAPAIALADVGMVFSKEELTAASEAADVVFLLSDITSVDKALNISRRTINIAKQSIFVGLGLSITFMIFAAFGFIAPVIGAFIQEAIDVSVILNALKASRKGH